MLAAVGRIAAAVAVPVTADLEAGAVGLHQEDTDHARGEQVDADVQTSRLAAIKEAGRRAGVDVVLNARVVVPESGPGRRSGPRGGGRGEAWAGVRGGGADCV
jgi:2-methylisocitrate lyase-like PEP mutase family enzyme